MSINQKLYEIMVPIWPFHRGQTRWLNIVTRVLGIRAYGYLKKRRVGDYNLLLDPGDPNDLQYYFYKVGAGYSFLMARLLRAGDCVIDIGANVGYFSALCAQRVGSEGRVHAIEASPMLIERLRQCVAEVDDGPIRIHHLAAWKSSGMISFNVASNSGWSALIENDTFETAAKVQVRAINLDEFVQREEIQRLRVLKLDIEGAEIDALIGAPKLLMRGQVDNILIEVEPNRLKAFGHTGQELADLAKENGYLPVCIIENDVIIPVTEDRRIPGSSNCDYLYVREELYKSIADLIL
jgi:FkbM family methyltransferase